VIVPLILNLGSRSTFSGQLYFRGGGVPPVPTLAPEPVDDKGKRRTLASTGIRIPDRPATILITVPTELSWLPVNKLYYLDRLTAAKGSITSTDQGQARLSIYRAVQKHHLNITPN
jgi:hypothetical protein